MPVTLFSLAPRGSATDRGTDRMAAWWKMTVAPAAARSTVARSRMSPSMISRVAACREAKGNSARDPVEKLSRMRTRAPSLRRRSTRCDPMNPAPPVTRATICTARIIPVSPPDLDASGDLPEDGVSAVRSRIGVLLGLGAGYFGGGADWMIMTLHRAHLPLRPRRPGAQSPEHDHRPRRGRLAATPASSDGQHPARLARSPHEALTGSPDACPPRRRLTFACHW